MSKPLVAVVGRPNVGKSTLFNKIAGRRISIVEDTPGVTRDRIYADAEWRSIQFGLIDTGGIEPDSEDVFFSRMREQAEIAMETADVILFLVDGKQGLTTADKDVADILLRTRKDIVLAVNKIDGSKIPDNYYDFFELGFGEPVAISAVNMLGLGDLLDRIVENMSRETPDEDEDALRIAVVGKPNVGKSSLVNALIGENRVIVTDIAGTTRDSVDTPFKWNDRDCVLIDTAGLRRKSKISGDIEKYSVIRTVTAVERCDVCLLMIDAQEGVTEQDKRIAGIAHEAGKGIVIVVNKWDLIQKDTGTMNEYQKKIHAELAFMAYAPDVFISVIQKQRLQNIMELAVYVSEKRALRVKTGQLNSMLADVVMMKPPPSDKGRRLKIYYIAQIGVKPPLFSLKVNDESLMHFSYARYLENRIRESFGFEGTSIKFVLSGKGDEK
jgi:GTP-binding protein